MIGAGPVGLFLAHALGQAGLQTLLLEKRGETEAPSMAIGLMPPSLRLFEQVRLSDPLVAAGVRVRTAVVHDQREPLGHLDFTSLPPPFSFILSLPQGELMSLLRKRLADQPSVQFIPSCLATGVRQDKDCIRVQTEDVLTGRASEYAARYAVACDGHDSDLRRFLQIPVSAKRYAPSFVMGDFPDVTDWADAAHLFFTPTGSVESFPLPNRRRRWVALSPDGRPDTASLVRCVQSITGVNLPAQEEQWHSSFTPCRQLAHAFYQGRALLCGDAAHVMSPIGGQGMNTGFADAWHLAATLRRLLRSGGSEASLLADYESTRRRAFRIAANRAACGMWLGAHKGARFSALRSHLIRRVLLRPPLALRLPAYFAMLTIPGGAIPAPETP
ncbi:MAG: NAD(P)/FAD-dependent oxidoreductase [Kiritimatiellia bacterium]|nr:NAD(P)/FAD-dependent oxidoreductase [Kiritimatiellia bacterium]